MAAWLKHLIQTNLFNNIIIFVILCAGVLVGLETYPSIMEKYGHIIEVSNIIILSLFILEIAAKMGAEGRRPWRYFHDSWNIFDFCIVAFCLLPTAAAQYATVLRLTRVLRIFRLVSQLPRLQLLVGTLIKSMPSMSYVLILLFLLFYIYATIGTFLFAQNDPIHFGNLQRSMLSLFRAVTLEDWTDLMYTQIYGSDVYGYQNQPDVKRQNRPLPVIAVVFFVSFILIGSMIVMNLFIGIIMNSILEIREEKERELIEERMSVIPSELLDIYRKLFSTMSARQFLRFWQMGTIVEANDSVIILEGERPANLLLLLHGEVDILFDNQIISQRHRGSFIAEMSFITGQAATATVKAKDHVQYIAWPQSDIKDLEISDPQTFIKIQGTLGRDLIDKLITADQAKV